MRVHILILAAGESKRLGRPKQLLPFGDGSLIQYMVQEAVGSNLGPVEVILGAYSDRIIPEIEGLNCSFRIHDNWKEGLSSSIAFGMRTLDEEDLDGILIVLSDQIYFEKGILLRLMEEARENIVMCRYQEGEGPPCYFDRKFFREFRDLRGDSGAKSIILKHKGLVSYISFENGHIDIDTPEDIKYLRD